MVFPLCLCSCPSQGSIEGLLRCAPCPPPMISYKEFRDHALNRSLLMKEVCSIAFRCNINGTDNIVDCPPATQPEHSLLGALLGTLFGLLMIAVIGGIYVAYKRISKRSSEFVYEHVLKASIEMRASDTLGEHLETETRFGYVPLTETLFAVPKEDTIHSRENIIDTRENLKEMHSQVTETLHEQFYQAEDVISVENKQPEKLNQQDSDDKETEANINQNDETEVFEDKYVQKKVQPVVQGNVGAVDSLVETSEQKTSDAYVVITQETSKEEEDENEVYHSAGESEDTPFIEDKDSDNV